VSGGLPGHHPAPLSPSACWRRAKSAVHTRLHHLPPPPSRCHTVE
jgi:hypothetical protein